MRLGWVKLPGISVFFFSSWLQPLKHLSSWKRPRSSQDSFLHQPAPSNSAKTHLQRPSHPHLQPSPLSCVLLRQSSILSASCDFWENSATMATAVSDRLTHTHNAGADASEFFAIIKSFHFSHPLTLSMLMFPCFQRSLWSEDQFALLSQGEALEEFPNIFIAPVKLKCQG